MTISILDMCLKSFYIRLKNFNKTFVVENVHLDRTFMDFGWGNGYVLIPKGHRLHGVGYDDIDVSVHGGLTFSNMVDSKMINKFNLDESDIDFWCIGFDTCHYEDSLLEWTKERVEEETEKLLLQINLLSLQNLN